MPRTKSRVREDFVSIEDAWANGGELEATKAAIRKYAQVIDVTESGRDMKPLITGMFDAMDRLRAIERRDGTGEGTPLAEILKMAAD